MASVQAGKWGSASHANVVLALIAQDGTPDIAMTASRPRSKSIRLCAGCRAAYLGLAVLPEAALPTPCTGSLSVGPQGHRLSRPGLRRSLGCLLDHAEHFSPAPDCRRPRAGAIFFALPAYRAGNDPPVLTGAAAALSLCLLAVSLQVRGRALHLILPLGLIVLVGCHAVRTVWAARRQSPRQRPLITGAPQWFPHAALRDTYALLQTWVIIASRPQGSPLRVGSPSAGSMPCSSLPRWCSGDRCGEWSLIHSCCRARLVS